MPLDISEILGLKKKEEPNKNTTHMTQPATPEPIKTPDITDLNERPINPTLIKQYLTDFHTAFHKGDWGVANLRPGDNRCPACEEIKDRAHEHPSFQLWLMSRKRTLENAQEQANQIIQQHNQQTQQKEYALSKVYAQKALELQNQLEYQLKQNQETYNNQLQHHINQGYIQVQVQQLPLHPDVEKTANQLNQAINNHLNALQNAVMNASQYKHKEQNETEYPQEEPIKKRGRPIGYSPKTKKEPEIVELPQEETNP